MKKATILMVVAAMSVMLAMTLTACKDEEPWGTETGSPANSIVNYLPEDGSCQKLISEMRAGNVPTQCEMLYDQMGSNDAVVVTDKSTICELYNLFVQITVVGPTDESVTDCYHYVIFTMQDGSTVSFNFEGDIWCYHDSEGKELRVQVDNTEDFWKAVRYLQKKK